MSKVPSPEQGFVPLVIPLVMFVALGTLVVASLQTQVTSQQNSNVKGVFLARGDDNSGGSSKDAESPEVKEPQETENENEVGNKVENELAKKDAQVEIKTKDGALEVEAQNASGAARSLTDNLNAQKVKIKYKVNGEDVEFKAEGGKFKFKTAGLEAESNFPLVIDSKTNQLMVQTPNGLRAIRILPDQAARIATTEGIIKKIDNVVLAENTATTETGDTVFDVKGTTAGRLFGLIPLSATVDTKVDSQTGQVVGTNLPLWFSLLSRFISF